MLIKVEGNNGKNSTFFFCSPKSKLKTDTTFSFWEQSQRNWVAEAEASVLYVTVGGNRHQASTNARSQHRAGPTPQPCSSDSVAYGERSTKTKTTRPQQKQPSDGRTLFALCKSHRNRGNWPGGTDATLA